MTPEQAGGAPGASAGHPARWWEPLEGGKVLCRLCPRECRMAGGQAGFCFVRRNAGGRLLSYSYGRPTGFGVDPIEKKPLNHFLPGSLSLSFGTVGCNMGCRFCQNWEMSKCRSDDRRTQKVTPRQVVDLALREGCSSISYTYNDPVVFAEFVIDTAGPAREEGLKNVMVTSGYVSPEARRELFEHIDAANVDLKGFTQSFYRRLAGADLEPVLDTLVWIRRETQVWLEVTTLLIPGWNDSESEIRSECSWIAENLGRTVPLHFTAFHPAFRMSDVPRTPPETLLAARRIAMEEGLLFVYVGNILDGEAQSTWCPGCGAALIRRDWHSVRGIALRDGRCGECGAEIPGVFA